MGKDKKKGKKGNQKSDIPKDNLGTIIGEIYNDAMQKLIRLIGSQPDIGKIKPIIEALHEETITELVELGKVKETLDG